MHAGRGPSSGAEGPLPEAEASRAGWVAAVLLVALAAALVGAIALRAGDERLDQVLGPPAWGPTGPASTPPTTARPPTTTPSTTPPTASAPTTAAPSTTGPPVEPTTAPTTGAPLPEVELRAGPGGGSGEIWLEWQAVPGAVGYRVLRAAAPDEPPVVVADVDVTTGALVAGPEVVDVWSAEHGYRPEGPPLEAPDGSARFEYVEVGDSGRTACLRVVAYDAAGEGPAPAAVCTSPP